MATPNREGFFKRAAEIAYKLRDAANEGRRFLVLCHFDADGLAAGAIIGKALYREKASLQIRVIRQVDSTVLGETSTIEHDLTVFTEIGSGYTRQIEERMGGGDHVIIDHHPLDAHSSSISYHINPIMFGYDGSREVSGAGVAYLVAKRLSAGNRDFSPLAVVGALGDMQDKNEQRRLKGLNKEIVGDAVESGLMEVKTDLILFGRETRPLHKALANTTSPYLPGLSGREDRCLSLITSLGIPLKEGENWKTVTNLSEEEKRRLVTAIVEYLSDEGFNPGPVKNLIGETYTLVREEGGTFLRDAREYASTLNACGRMGRGGLGISLCLGDRGAALREVEEVLKKYKTVLSQVMEEIAQASEKVQRMEALDVVRGEDFIDEDFTGTISSMLNSSGGFDPAKIVVVISKPNPESGAVKISARAPQILVEKNIDLGVFLHELSEKYSGTGGGHPVAAGATIPYDSLNAFLGDFDRMVAEKAVGEDP